MVSIHSSIGGEDTDGGDQPDSGPVSKIGKHFADWCNMFLATNVTRDQGAVTPKCAILTAVTGSQCSHRVTKVLSLQPQGHKHYCDSSPDILQSGDKATVKKFYAAVMGSRGYSQIWAVTNCDAAVSLAYNYGSDPLISSPIIALIMQL